jgi:hypothetical protein
MAGVMRGGDPRAHLVGRANQIVWGGQHGLMVGSDPVEDLGIGRMSCAPTAARSRTPFAFFDAQHPVPAVRDGLQARLDDVMAEQESCKRIAHA